MDVNMDTPKLVNLPELYARIRADPFTKEYVLHISDSHWCMSLYDEDTHGGNKFAAIAVVHRETDCC